MLLQFVLVTDAQDRTERQPNCNGEQIDAPEAVCRCATAIGFAILPPPLRVTRSR
jgi:hypothetical protein